jgi:uncharacterized membrane protein YdjX (TVP38/TMEM64 family)
MKLVLLGIVLVGFGAAFKFLPVDEYLARFLEHVQELGFWGPVLMAVAYVLATVLMVPGLILTLGAGFAFGLVKGAIAVSVGSLLGATAAFLIGRTVARRFVEQKVGEYPKFVAVDRAVQDAGFKIVLLTRLSPAFPFNVLNYLFSITSVRFRDYFFASWIGMLPGTLMYVYFGTAIKNLADLAAGRFEGGAPQKVLLLVGLVATVAVTVYITKLARNAIRDYVPSEETSDQSR